MVETPPVFSGTSLETPLFAKSLPTLGRSWTSGHSITKRLSCPILEIYKGFWSPYPPVLKGQGPAAIGYVWPLYTIHAKELPAGLHLYGVWSRAARERNSVKSNEEGWLIGGFHVRTDSFQDTSLVCFPSSLLAEGGSNPKSSVWHQTLQKNDCPACWGLADPHTVPLARLQDSLSSQSLSMWECMLYQPDAKAEWV